MRNNLFLNNCANSEGAVCHNVLYYQQLFLAHYQVSFYVNFVLSNYQQSPVLLKAGYTFGNYTLQVNDCKKNHLKISTEKLLILHNIVRSNSLWSSAALENSLRSDACARLYAWGLFRFMFSCVKIKQGRLFHYFLQLGGLFEPILSQVCFFMQMLAYHLSN